MRCKVLAFVLVLAGIILLVTTPSHAQTSAAPASGNLASHAPA